MIYYAVEPFGAEAPYIGHAITASTIANANRKKGTKAITPEDMMPKFEKPKQQTTDEMIGVARMLTHALGGQDLTE